MEIQWEAEEFEKPQRSVSWYWTSIIIATLLIAFSIWQKDLLFGLFVLIAEILMIIWGNKDPRIISFSLNEKEIVIDNKKVHKLLDIETFSVFEKEDGSQMAEIILKKKDKYSIPFMIQIPIQKIDDAKTILKKSIKEVPYDLSFIDSIQKISKF